MKTFIINYIIVTKILLFVKVFLELVFERKNVLIDKRNFLFLPIKKRPKLIWYIFEKMPEARINEAVAKGEFDNLPGNGQPLDLSDYFRTPVQFRIIFDFKKKAGFCRRNLSC